VIHFNTLYLATLGAYEVVVMVVGWNSFITLCSVQDINLRDHLIVHQEVEFSVYGRFVDQQTPFPKGQ
jgi:hypothetical protein